MDTLWAAFARVATPQGDTYWLYFVSALAIAFIYYWLHHYGEEKVSLSGFVAFCFPKRIYTHPSAILDFKYVFLNLAVYAWLIAPLTFTSAVAAKSATTLLVDLFGIPTVPFLARGFWINLAVTVAAVIAADVAFFISHYLQHRVAFLWEFHKVHHAAEVLHPLVQYRQHPIDTALDLVLMGSASGLVIGISSYLSGAVVDGLTILQTNAVVFLFNVSGKHLRHSHVPVSYGPKVSRVIISPMLHQVHHSCAPPHIGKNYGGIFSLWDLLAGTLYLPRANEELKLGLGEEGDREYRSVLRLYFLPFIKNGKGGWRLLRRVWEPRRPPSLVQSDQGGPTSVREL